MNKIIGEMNILTQKPIKEYTNLSNFLLVVGIFIAVICVIIMIKSQSEFDGKIFKYSFYFYLFGLALALCSKATIPFFYEDSGRYKYECELDDSVSAKYIENNFNIISVSNGIWTLEDK